jgi:hypothetical protein
MRGSFFKREEDMKITNHANLPDAIVRAVVNDPYPHGKTGDISVTTLISPPQMRILKKRHENDIEEDAADRIWALLGQSVHTILERAETAALTEDRLFAHCEGWSVSGQYDRLAYLDEIERDPQSQAERPARVLQDYKVTSTWSILDGAKAEWVEQLNILAWLARRNGYRVDKVQIAAILRDWSKGKARQGGNYPQKPVVLLDLPCWSQKIASRYVAAKVRFHQRAEEKAEAGLDLPPCTDDERWIRGEKWAVKKPGRKTAIRVFDTSAEAEALAAQTPKGYVENRPGEPVRCADYCPVAQFCEQYQKELARADQREAA